MRNGLIAASALLCLGVCGGSAAAQPATNNCQGFAPGFTPNLHRVFVVKKGAPLYDTKAATSPSGDPLRFGDELGVNSPEDSGSRIQVKQRGQNGRVGWIDKSNIHCRSDAMRVDRTGLFLRAFVRIATFAAPAPGGPTPTAPGQRTPAPVESGGIRLSHNTSGECEARLPCPTVSRFNWFFIWADENDHYLVSTYPTSRGRFINPNEPQFLGWLPKRNAILWPTAVALRPSIELGDVRPGEPEKYVCAYNSPENIGSTDRRLCSEVYGGRRWFTKSSRLAILEETDRYYKVAIAASLQGEGSRDTGDGVPGGLVRQYKGVDIVFVVDGTGSMGSAIKAIRGEDGRKGLVARISEEIKRTYTNIGPIRFGFQIYRDSPPVSVDPNRDGVRESEALKLGQSCADNSAGFNPAFAKVKAEEPSFPNNYVDDDFFENTFGGIVQAATQFNTCPDHFKVLIVIGDHGYSPDAQSKRERAALTARQVADRIKGRADAAAASGAAIQFLPALVFVQTPRDVSGVSNVRAYDEAYDAFDNQARDILNWLYKGLVSEADLLTIRGKGVINVAPGQLVADALPAEVTERVKTLYRPDLVDAVRSRCIATGASITECIDQVLGDDRVNAPVILKAILKQNLCRDLGAECERAARDSVGEAFIAKAQPPNALSLDVMLDKDSLERWTQTLRYFADAGAGGAQRTAAVRSLAEKLQSIFVIDLRTDRVLRDEIEGSTRSLPGAAKGLIFKYKINELASDVNGVEDCEIGLLAAYAREKNKMLTTIFENPDRRPRWDNNLPPSGCRLTPGREIPLIRNIRNELFAPPLAPNPPPQRPGHVAPRYAVDFNQGSFTYYWLPVEYLP